MSGILQVLKKFSGTEADDNISINYMLYCHAINKFGKKTFLFLLKAFYKGGLTNYFDYLNSEYDLSEVDLIFSDERKHMLKHQSPEDFDLPLLHILLQVTCFLYCGKEECHKSNSHIISVEHGIEAVMLRYHDSTTCGDYKFSRRELGKCLDELTLLLGMLVYRAAEWSEALCVCHEDVKKIHNEIYFGMLHQQDFESRDCPYRECFLETERMRGIKDEEEICRTPWVSLQATYQKLISEQKNSPVGIMLPRKASCEKLTFPKKSSSPEKFSYKNPSSSKKVFLKKSSFHKNSTLLEKILSAMSEASEINTKTDLEHKENIEGPEGNNTGISLEASSLSDNSTTEENSRTFSVTSKTYASLSCVVKPIRKTSVQKGLSPSVLYTATDILLKEHQKYSRRPGRQVSLKNLLEVEGMNDEVAEIIIVSGEVGMGKTMLLKYILEKWGDGEAEIEGLDSRSLVFFTELRDDSYKNFTDFVADMLKTTAEKGGITQEVLRQIVLDMPILVTLDGYDESAENSCELVKEMLRITGTDLKVIVTCRPHYVDTIYKQIPKRRKKHVTHLSLNGIPSPYRAEFIGRLIDSRIPGGRNKLAKDKITEGLISRLPEIYGALGEDLCNPLMLTIITGMWMEHPVIEIDSQTNLFLLKDS